jgi:hypothetical protein
LFLQGKSVRRQLLQQYFGEDAVQGGIPSNIANTLSLAGVDGGGSGASTTETGSTGFNKNIA